MTEMLRLFCSGIKIFIKHFKENCKYCSWLQHIKQRFT